MTNQHQPLEHQEKLKQKKLTRKGKDPNAPFVREKLSLPGGHNKLLLHSCCALLWRSHGSDFGFRH